MIKKYIMFIKKIKNLRLFERRLLLKSLKSRLFINGLLILSIYAALAFGVYRFFLLNLESQIKTETVLELRAITLSHDLLVVINATKSTILYTKNNDKTKLKISLSKLKKSIPRLSKDFIKIETSLKKEPDLTKTILPYMKEAKRHWNYYTVPILLVLIKHPQLVASRIFSEGVLGSLYKSAPFYASRGVKTIENHIKKESLLRKNINIIFILGSFIIFSITLIFIIIVVIKNEIIKESEAKYFRIFKSNSAPIVMLDASTVDIEDANYSAVNFYGYSEQEFKGMNITKLNPFVSKRELKDFLDNLRNTGGNVISTRHRLKNGEVKDVDIYATIIEDIGGKTYYIDIIHDVTEKRMFENKVKEDEELFRSISENMINGIIIYREKIVYVNKAAQNIMGYTEEEMSGFHIWDIYNLNENEEKYMIKKIAERRLKGEKFETKSFELKAFTKDGKELWLLIYATTIFYKGEWGGLVTFIDVTDKIRLEKEIEQERQLYKNISEKDALTGIFNRRKFDSSLKEMVKLASRYKRPLSLAMFDIDHFKEVNDNLGHQAGDGVLGELTELVETSLRDTDIFARYGGEEFMIIMPETDMGDADNIAERIRKTVESHIFKNIPVVTISFGVSLYSDGEDMDSFVKRVDGAMYKAKQGGRNRVEVL